LLAIYTIVRNNLFYLERAACALTRSLDMAKGAKAAPGIEKLKP